MSATVPRPYKPYPWPWGQPSVLTPEVEPVDSWLDADLGEDDSGSDYAPSSSEDAESDDSSDSGSEHSLDDSELADIGADAATGWPSSPTPSQKEIEEREDLARQIAELVKAEQDAAAAYDPDAVAALVTELYELLVTMGHWSEGSIQYPPHTAPSLNEALAAELGYAPSAISLMQKLPYVRSESGRGEDGYLIARTQLANYTHEDDLREGRHPYPYQYLPGCPDLDPWLLPLALPNRDGWNIMFDTRLGVVRANCTERSPPKDTVEWRRHGEIPDGDWDRATWTEYRRTPLVPAPRYLSEVIYAYRSLARLPLINADRSDPRQKLEDYHPSYPKWLLNQEREEKEGLLALYRECGWPDNWRRSEFIAKWEATEKEIKTRARQAMRMEDDED
ncbi:hypothetical protein FB451DRAFT_283755 [Mycena latifolia]|nr:hypothetical protein FB451DRAFT_283755 [Mycena latifolia]